MASPIRVDWYNRPGIGEYGAWRVHGSHQGFDTYCKPYATIYGTSEGGTVIGKGYAAGGWGHWVDVHYPKVGSRPAYTQRDCHMAEATPLAKGADVGLGTALGRVGQTGNAKGIAWWHLGAWLWHVHSEVYLSALVAFKKRTNPLTVWGVTTAGGKGTPIIKENPMGYYIAKNQEDSSKSSSQFIWGPGLAPQIIEESTASIFRDGGVPEESMTSGRWLWLLDWAKRYGPPTSGSSAAVSDAQLVKIAAEVATRLQPTLDEVKAPTVTDVVAGIAAWFTRK